MVSSTLLTYDTVKTLLSPEHPSSFSDAEKDRMWSGGEMQPGDVLEQLYDTVLMRTYDTWCSGSCPDDTGRMQARDARMRLDKREVRRDTLTKHADYKVRGPTPYISFTNSPRSLERLADFRTAQGTRGDQEVVLVDPRIRLGLRLPVLQYSQEMSFYGIVSPYRDDYWRDHYLCLWEVTPEEIVGIWDWNELRREPEWFEKTIKPALERNRRRRRRELTREHGCPEPRHGPLMESTQDTPYIHDAMHSHTDRANSGIGLPFTDEQEKPDGADDEGRDLLAETSDETVKVIDLENSSGLSLSSVHEDEQAKVVVQAERGPPESEVSDNSSVHTDQSGADDDCKGVCDDTALSDKLGSLRVV